MTRIALLTGSFDPPTLGHLDIILRASKLVDHLIIGVAVRLEKKEASVFSAEEKVDQIRAMTKAISNVEVRSYSHLTTEFAKSVNATFIFRGLRMTSPTEDEFQMALANRTLSGLETVFILGGEQYSHISSTIVKEIAKAGGNLDGFLSENVQTALLNKLRP